MKTKNKANLDQRIKRLVQRELDMLPWSGTNLGNMAKEARRKELEEKYRKKYALS